jgi:hypothetical protein
MKILRSSARKTNFAPASNFTAVVFSDEVVVGQALSRCLSRMVPVRLGTAIWSVRLCSCSASGAGRVQREANNYRKSAPVIRSSSRRMWRHWHGAAPDKLFSHLATSEFNDKGEGRAWFEHVSDEIYNAPPAAVG